MQEDQAFDARIKKIKSDLNDRLDKHQAETIVKLENTYADLKQDLTNLAKAHTVYASRISAAENTIDQVQSNFRNYTDHVRFELQGANEDQLNMHDDTLQEHEKRLNVLELS